jgi:SWI/SNF-related matrix-associated actin-dependent regulator of chromatin subfamily A3
MKQICIRHQKMQVVDGVAALALPNLESKIVWLTMSDNERKLYTLAAHNDDEKVQHIERAGAKGFVLDMALRYRRQACANIYKFTGPQRAFSEEQALLMYEKRPKPGTSFIFEYSPKLAECTKLRALCDDLQMLRTAEPDCTAVVFTQYLETQAAVVEMLKRDASKQLDRVKRRVVSVGLNCGSFTQLAADPHDKPFMVLEINGKVAAEKRHKIIRKFQGRGGAATRGPKVLVMTLRVGSVGMTLTDASRVYLFEPALDPAVEVQAAGRIHRLGQTKEVLVTRFVYRDSIDENIVRLHEAIAAGHVSVDDGVVPAEGVCILTGARTDMDSAPQCLSVTSSAKADHQGRLGCANCGKSFTSQLVFHSHLSDCVGLLAHRPSAARPADDTPDDQTHEGSLPGPPVAAGNHSPTPPGDSMPCDPPPAVQTSPSTKEPKESTMSSPMDPQNRALSPPRDLQVAPKFVGVGARGRKWSSSITHEGAGRSLGMFETAEDAARAYDTAARELRGEAAHGFRTTSNRTSWLNFPTTEEQQRREVAAAKEEAAARVVPKFIGVAATSHAGIRKWSAKITHEGTPECLGYFDRAEDAARAYDSVARVMGKTLLNFPTVEGRHQKKVPAAAKPGQTRLGGVEPGRLMELVDSLSDHMAPGKRTLPSDVMELWSELWTLCEELRWRRTPTGRPSSPWVYFPPGVTRETGRQRIDYFDSRNGVVRHLSTTAGQVNTTIKVGSLLEVEFKMADGLDGLAEILTGRVRPDHPCGAI